MSSQPSLVDADTPEKFTAVVHRYQIVCAAACEA